MKKILVLLLSYALLAFAGASVALAEDYIVTITVDGKPVTLAISNDTDTFVVESTTAGAKVISVEKAAPVAAPVAAPPGEAEAYNVNRNANLRAGPGTTFAVAGSVKLGDVVSVVGKNGAGDWYQLSTGQWIAAFLVNRATAPQSSPAAAPAPTVAPTPTEPPAPAPVQNCDPAYPTLCIPPNSPDLDCGDIGARKFQVLPPDPHRFDGDRDGVGCES